MAARKPKAVAADTPAPRQQLPSNPADTAQPAPARAAAGPDLDTRSAPMTDTPQDRNVDQIRDILFGGQMRDYERRFSELAERLESESARTRQDLDKRIAQIEKRQDEQFEKLSRLLRQEITDRTQSIDDLETRALQAQRTLRGELQAGIHALESELGSKDEHLREELTALRQLLAERAGELSAQQQRADADVRADKVGRADLAALLTEVALRLKGEFELPLPRK
jgi:hypothetical protein